MGTAPVHQRAPAAPAAPSSRRLAVLFFVVTLTPCLLSLHACSALHGRCIGMRERSGNRNRTARAELTRDVAAVHLDGRKRNRKPISNLLV